MTSKPEFLDLLLRDRLGALTPEEQAAKEKSLRKYEESRDRTIAAVAEWLLGLRPEHGATVYTQHPLMAGVLRQALREAYDKGSQEFSMQLLKSMTGDG